MLDELTTESHIGKAEKNLTKYLTQCLFLKMEETKQRGAMFRHRHGNQPQGL